MQNFSLLCFVDIYIFSIEYLKFAVTLGADGSFEIVFQQKVNVLFKGVKKRL